MPSSQAIDSSSHPSLMDPDPEEEEPKPYENYHLEIPRFEEHRADFNILFTDDYVRADFESIREGYTPRLHENLISIWEQAIIAHFSSEEGYKWLNLALRGQILMTEFLRAQERVLNAALEKLPKFQGSTIRGTGESEIQRFANARVGDVIEYPNFVSTTTEQVIADDFMGKNGGEYVLYITSKTGVELGEMAAANEEEVLFQSKKKFRVTAKRERPRFTEDDPLINEVYLEEI